MFKRIAWLGLIALATMGCQEEAQSQQRPGDPAPQRVEEAPPTLDAQIAHSRRTAITRAVETVAPAVVSINVTGVEQVAYRDPFDAFFAPYFGRRPRPRVYEKTVHQMGSGFVISPDGYIVTNDHVAGNATEILVAFPDGEILEGRLVGADEVSDIALIKVDPPEPLPYLAFDEDEEAIVGEWVIALGNPFGLFEAADPSVTVGVVSAVGRDFSIQEGRVFSDMIQTDAAINSGNSGGPLVNATGEVIGVNTFIYSRTGGSVGLGFAVPAERAARIVRELRETGRVDRSIYTGLSVSPVNARIARVLRLQRPEGVLVEAIDQDSPADEAGFESYDVILAIAGKPVRTLADARAHLADYRPGDRVTFTVLRDGARRDLTLVLSRQS